MEQANELVLVDYVGYRNRSCHGLGERRDTQERFAMSDIRWRPFSEAPKDGTTIIAVGKWLPYEKMPGGETAHAIMSWSTFQSNETGFKWIVGSSSLMFAPRSTDSINVEWLGFMPIDELPAFQQEPKS